MREILGVLVPFFAIVALGYGAARFRLIWQSGLNGLNAYRFNFALPVMRFRGVATRDLAELADVRLAFVYGLTTIALFLLTAAIAARAFGLDRPTALFHGLGAVQSNNGFLALPLMPALFGEAAIAPLAPLFVGFVFASLRIHLPGPAQTTVDLLAASAAPAVLFALGASLSIHRGPLPEALARRINKGASPPGSFGSSRRGQAVRVALMNVVKLAVMPVVVWAVGTHLIPLPPFHLKVGVAVAALPTGVNLYLFSSRYLRDVGAFSAAILSSTVISVASLAFVVWLLARA
ncbi:MAG TPA: AEC family transporter [Burkholderiales bacterium]|nr:AEC family transporter [Burkholderiales bacterium]